MMTNNELTKAEIKAVKRGRAYKNWVKGHIIVFVVLFVWIFGCVGFAAINTVTTIIYGVITAIIVIWEIYSFKITCWRCHRCKAKLPSYNQLSSQTIKLPFLVKNCPHCNADLTEQ